MKQLFRLGLLFSFLLTSLAPLQAGVVYQGGKWRSEGGLSKYFFSKGKQGRNAVELMEKAKKAQQDGEIKEALELYDAVIEGYPASEQAPQALYLSGRIQQERSFLENAFKRYEKIVTHYPRYPDYGKVTAAQFEVAELLGRGAKTRFFFDFLPWFSSRKTAIQYYEAFLKYAPNSPHAAQAYLDLGELYARNKKMDKAVELLDQVTSDYPETAQAPQALAHIGEIERSLVMGTDYDQGANFKARDYYTDLLLLYPLSPEAPEAKDALNAIAEEIAESRYAIGKFYWQRRNNPNARILFKEAIALAPKSEVAEKARQALEKIRKKELPAKGLGEVLLGRYKRPSSKRERAIETKIRMLENQQYHQPGVR